MDTGFIQAHGWNIIVGLASSLTTLAVSHFAVGIRVAEIRGQLRTILKMETKVDSQAVVVDGLRSRVDKHDYDLKQAHAKLRSLSQTSSAPKPLNGG